jgi:hypothetical protein
MLLTTLKFVALVWLGLLTAALICIAVAYLFELARAARRRLVRRS